MREGARKTLCRHARDAAKHVRGVKWRADARLASTLSRERILLFMGRVLSQSEMKRT